MTDLRMWSQLSAEERAEAVTKARAIIEGGEIRWHVVARLCGIKGGIGLRTAIDAGWRAKRQQEDRKRCAGRSRAKPNRPVPEAPKDMPAYVPASITLPRISFLEG